MKTENQETERIVLVLRMPEGILKLIDALDTRIPVKADLVNIAATVALGVDGAIRGYACMEDPSLAVPGPLEYGLAGLGLGASILEYRDTKEISYWRDRENARDESVLSTAGTAIAYPAGLMIGAIGRMLSTI